MLIFSSFVSINLTEIFFSLLLFFFLLSFPLFSWTQDLPCIYRLELLDSGGDGWDGAFVTFEIDGVATNYTFTSGSAATFNVDVPAGASLVISYTSGAFEEEHVYTIETPDGDVRGPFGPNPAPCIN